MRAFRPSKIASVDGDTEDSIDQIVKIAQVRRYSRRAAAHLPLFEKEAKPASLVAAAEEEKWTTLQT